MIRLSHRPIAGMALILGLALAGPAAALDLTLPFSSQLTTRVVTAPDSHALATGPFADGALPVMELEGQVERQVFRIPGQALTTLQIFAPIREQIIAAGYETIFECHAASCGGFDFRFATEVLPAPDMYVDLTDFRFLSAARNTQDHLGLLVSASSNAGFVQMIRVTSAVTSEAMRVLRPGESGAAMPPAGTSSPAAAGPVQNGTLGTPITPLSLAESLNQRGHVILSDLSFQTGSSQLAPGRTASLENLAAFLRADPSRRVALVGHTDAVGALSGNIALSRQRASAVRDRLVQDYGIPARQLEAEGMGYLSPIAPNTTIAGREANRRVEAVLLNTE
jgi:outer membrane protein OmpA-like peptidoglycan-associated protein